jgi:signal transduction histidine kinase
MLLAVPVFGGPDIRGLPFTRSYALEDIGYGSRGAQLRFDPFGRVAVVHDGIYAVLNDTVWLNMAEREKPGLIAMTNVISAPDGRTYYGSLASWGRVEIRADGRLHAVPLVPADPPDWIRLASFTDLLATADGVYFVSPSGVVFWDFHREIARLFRFTRISRAFRLGRRVYISAFDHILHYIDIETGRIESAAGTGLDETVVVLATILDETHALLSLIDGRLVVYDGKRIAPWPARPRDELAGQVAVLQHLVDGHIAVGATGKGLFLFSAQGELLLALDTPEYHRITALANREPGVLWVAKEDGIDKILYSSALTAFGQRLGLTVAWPVVERWDGRVFVVSNGSLYQALAGSPASPSRFELYPYQPAGGAWALAAVGPHMLVGGSKAVFAIEADGRLHQVAALEDLAHLVMIDANHCYVIGRTEIAFLEWREGGWSETAQRTRGVTYPSVVHRVKQAVWIEMGGKSGRLWLRHGKPQLDMFPNTSWTNKPWVNIGSIDDVAVLSGSPGERRFFDERRSEWCEAPQLEQLLDRSPFWIERVEKDGAGTIWATHDEGVVRFTPRGQDYEIDTGNFDLINDRYPVVQILPGDDVWISASQSLYHVQRRWTESKRSPPVPVVVSMVDAQANVELLAARRSADSPLRLPFTNNHLSFRFYSGSEVWRRPPVYEYRLTEGEAWTTLAGSELGFRELPEGHYRLQIRRIERHIRSGPVASLAFEVLPPWHRTWPAYILFGLMGLMLLAAIIRWSSYLERKRSRMLEQVVRDRTSQLEATMTQLGEETRNAATLAERDRLANEIHDSVQQGLTGAILQLDTTLKRPAIPADIGARLKVVRNMISYARQEVQHAVWDMESPLLEGTDLGKALRNLTTFAEAGGVPVEVIVSGQPPPLERPVSHNMLRIAQEATTNAFRHAKAQKVTIRLAYDADTASLEISDDGQGFNPEAVFHERIGHLGLRGIRARGKRLGGRVSIRSGPGQGTSIRVQVPVSGRPI